MIHGQTVLEEKGRKSVREEAWNDRGWGRGEPRKKYNRICRKNCFPHLLLIPELSEKKEVMRRRVDLGKVIVCSMTGFILLLKGNNLQRKRETERNQEQGGRDKEEDIWGGGGEG